MSWWKYRRGPVDYWVTEALTQFINGVISGWRHGVGTGAGTGIITGTTDVADNMTAWQQIVVSASATAFAMVMNGFSHVTDWHKTNPFPNPWPKPPEPPSA